MIAHVRDQLSAYLDGELPALARSAVEAHLRSCPECARHLEELGAVDEAARELDVAAPPGYFDSLPARVSARLAAPRRRTPPAWVWAAAAALALAALTPFTALRTTAPRPEATPAEGAEGMSTVPASAPAEPAPARPADTVPALDALQKGGDDKPAAAPMLERNAAPERTDAEKRRFERERTLATRPGGGRAQGQQYSGPFAQAPPPPAPPAQAPPAQAPPAQAGQAPAPAETAREEQAKKDNAAESKLQAESRGKSERDQAAAAGALAAAAPPAAKQVFAQAAADEDRYRALLARQAGSAEAARKLHDDWDALARSHPDGPRADEARVRAMEASALAFDLGADPRDRERARAAARAYLARPDALQAARVRALLARLSGVD